jgi:hypothetical protein
VVFASTASNVQYDFLSHKDNFPVDARTTSKDEQIEVKRKNEKVDGMSS